MSASTVTRATFLFTDIEGSTRLLQQLGNDYAELLERHQRLLSEAMIEAGGRVFGSEGDALFASLPEPSAAVAAAAAAQRALAAQRWPAGVELRVRMGIHTGEAIVTGDNYVGLPLHQVARISAADDLPGILLLLYDFALLAFKSGDEERAWRLAGAADRLRQSTGAGIADLSVDFIGWTIPARPTGDNETRRAWDEGASMTHRAGRQVRPSRGGELDQCRT